MTSDPSMLTIDGSQGEGGGQVLRTSLALSIATARPFRMLNIRAGREKPGLMRQHLTCVQAAAAISAAKVQGACVGAREISFTPGPIRPGSYHFPIGTAGSCIMVLQAILPPLLIADAASSVTIEGGTHNNNAPPFEFFERALLPLLARAGARVRARCERPGFYPAGGGRVVVEVEPAGTARPLELLSRGDRTHSRAWAHVSRLPASIAQRELDVVMERLGVSKADAQIAGLKDPIGPGNAVVVELGYEHVSEVFFAVGEVGKSAELVARSVSDEAREYIAGERPVGVFLADQLMVPLAVLGGGHYSTGKLSDHSITNIATMKLFGANVVAGADGHVRISRLGS